MKITGPTTERWPDFDGTLSVDEETLTEAADDFGHLVRQRPAAVLRAGSVDDVVRVVRHARTTGRRLVPRGTGHAAYGQAQIGDGGVVVDLRGLDRVHSLGSRSITVDAGILWGELVRHTTAAGLVPPVLTDFLELTVGGTLSAGGITGTSFRWGAQIDNVDELVVVTGAGEVVHCSPTEEPALFQSVLGGFGQIAIIVRATVRLEVAPPSVDVFRLYYEDVPSMTAELRRLVSEGPFEYLLGVVTPIEAGGWEASIEAAVGSDAVGGDGRSRPDGLHRRADERFEVRSFTDWLRRVDEPVGVLQDLGLWQSPHPWLDLFVRDAALDVLMREVLDSDVSRGVGPRRILLYPLCTSRFRQPMLRLPRDEEVVLLNVLSTASAAQATAMVATNRRLFERNRDLGGTAYPISAVPLDPTDWRRQLGPEWERLAGAKRRFDPDRVLSPGTRVFENQLPS